MAEQERSRKAVPRVRSAAVTALMGAALLGVPAGSAIAAGPISVAPLDEVAEALSSADARKDDAEERRADAEDEEKRAKKEKKKAAKKYKEKRKEEAAGQLSSIVEDISDERLGLAIVPERELEKVEEALDDLTTDNRAEVPEVAEKIEEVKEERPVKRDRIEVAAAPTPRLLSAPRSPGRSSHRRSSAGGSRAVDAGLKSVFAEGSIQGAPAPSPSSVSVGQARAARAPVASSQLVFPTATQDRPRASLPTAFLAGLGLALVALHNLTNRLRWAISDWRELRPRR